MAVDFAGFSKMVDALGGVEVCSTTPLEDYELGTVLPNAGRQTIDGHTALNYVRARQVTTETNGDYGRIKRQQLFLSSLLRSLISKEVFFSLNKLNNVVNQFIDDSFVDNIDTKDLVELGQSLQNVAAGRITFLTVPTTGYMDEWGNEHLREDDNRAIFDAIINDDPLPEERNADNTPVPGTPESMTNTTAESSTSETPNAGDVSATPARWSTPSPPTRRRDRAGVEFDGPGRAWRQPPQPNCSSTASTSQTPDDYPGSAVLDDGVLLAGQRSRPPPRWHRRSPSRPSSASTARATPCRWCSGPTSSGRAPETERFLGAGPRPPRRLGAPRRNCPRTSPSPTPPIPAASSGGISGRQP